MELGVPVCIVDDGNGSVLGCEIMREGTDTDIAVPLIKRCHKGRSPTRACSFNKGVHSPKNRRKLDTTQELNIPSKKGEPSTDETEPHERCLLRKTACREAADGGACTKSSENSGFSARY